MGGRWNPWRELRGRPWLRLLFAQLDCPAFIEQCDDETRLVVLDARLDRRARRCALAHELVHDERGVLFPPGAPLGLIDKEELAVERTVAARLVPERELSAFVARVRGLGEAVTAGLVGDEFDVTVEVATVALRSLTPDDGDQCADWQL